MKKESLNPSEFESKFAETNEEMLQVYDLLKEMITVFDKIIIDPKNAQQFSDFYLQNPHLGKVMFIRHKPTQKVAAMMIFNFHYSLKWDEIMNRGVSLIVRKEFRGKGLVRLFFSNVKLWMELIKVYRSDWTFVVRDNHNAIKIYNHWGQQFYSSLRLNFMDLMLRKDPSNCKQIPFDFSLAHFERKFASFGFRQNLGFEVVELQKEHLESISQDKDRYQNDINTHFDRFSMKGLKEVIRNPAQAACLIILHQGRVFGIVSLMKYFFYSRNGFDVWVSGIFFDPKEAKAIHTDANLFIIQALQRFFIEYSKKVSWDLTQPICIFLFFLNFVFTLK